MLPRGRVQRYPPGRNMPDVPMPGVVGGIFSPYDMGGLPMRDVPQAVPIGTLASALANATPEHQRMVDLFPRQPIARNYLHSPLHEILNIFAWNAWRAAR